MLEKLTRNTGLRALLASIAVIIAVMFVVLGHNQASADQEGPADANGNHPQYSNYPDNGLSGTVATKVDNRSFYIGDVITMPNGLQMEVTKVERNWQPSLPVSETLGKHQVGDNPKNREIILVWFTAKNTSTAPLLYSDSDFTLRGNVKHDQRLANLAVLPATSYGSFNKSPWLLPGESSTTFVPFLVTPGKQNLTFQYYAFPLHFDPNSKDKTIPCLVVHLDARPGIQAAATASVTFSGDQVVTVNP